jgi:hypothetical protein
MGVSLTIFNGGYRFPAYGLSHENGRLRVVVISLAGQKSLAFIETLRRFHIGGRIEVQPLIAALFREFLERLQQPIRDALSAISWPDI